MRPLSIILNNFWPKVISLVLAVATWFYVFDLVNTENHAQKGEMAGDIFSKHGFVLKEVPVKPVFTGRSPAGYRVVFEEVTVMPANVSVLCPSELAPEINELKTEKIDLSEYTRSALLRLGLRSDIRALKIEEKAVEVKLPVVKSEIQNTRVQP